MQLSFELAYIYSRLAEHIFRALYCVFLIVIAFFMRLNIFAGTK